MMYLYNKHDQDSSNGQLDNARNSFQFFSNAKQHKHSIKTSKTR